MSFKYNDEYVSTLMKIVDSQNLLDHDDDRVQMIAYCEFAVYNNNNKGNYTTAQIASGLFIKSGVPRSGTVEVCYSYGRDSTGKPLYSGDTIKIAIPYLPILSVTYIYNKHIEVAHKLIHNFTDDNDNKDLELNINLNRAYNWGVPERDVWKDIDENLRKC